MIKQNVVDSVLKSAIGKIQDEMAALVGEEIQLTDLAFKTRSKEEFFETPRDKCALSRLAASGDFSGEGYLIFPLKDAVLLGAKLIMLPEEEVIEKVKNPQFDGEEADAWGEVANIIVGALTAALEDLFPKKLHFKRTETEPLIPTKVDVEGPEPFPPGNYHTTSAKVQIGPRKLGELELVFPLEVLGMEAPAAPAADAEKPQPEEKKAAASEAASSTSEEKEQAAKSTSTAQSGEERAAATQVAAQASESTAQADSEEIDEEPAQSEETTEAAEESGTAAKPEGTIPQATVNKVLDTALSEIAKDVSDLLAQQLTCEQRSYTALSKEEYFALPRDKSAMARMAASGEADGEAYLLARQKDAILFGGKLIMLPEDEIEAKVKTGNFDEEDGDAYGEVANIVTGSLTKIFDDLYPRKLHLKRTEVEAVVPTKVDVDAATPFPPGQYYLASCNLALEGKPLGEFDLLFPVELLGIKLDQPAEEAQNKEKQTASSRQAEGAAAAAKSTKAAETEQGAPQTSPHQAQGRKAGGPSSAAGPAAEIPPPADPTPHVLVMAETEELSATICSQLDERGLRHCALTFRDDVRQCAREVALSGAILVMEKVAEQGFALAIKVRSILRDGSPLIMAGPEWTRTLVIKAVRYGACDIIVTPASREEIQSKIDEHLAERLAANQ